MIALAATAEGPTHTERAVLNDAAEPSQCNPASSQSDGSHESFDLVAPFGLSPQKLSYPHARIVDTEQQNDTLFYIIDIADGPASSRTFRRRYSEFRELHHSITKCHSRQAYL